MNLHQLYYFRTVAELKHFTKAAKQLAVAQPTLSRAINELEAELGISLFDRGNRTVKLTKYGELFLDYVNESLNTLDEGRDKLADLIDPGSGSVGIAYVSSLDVFMSYLMARFYSEHQGVRGKIQLSPLSNKAIQTALVNGSNDLGLGTRPSDSQLMCQCLGEHELMLLVSSAHPLSAQDSVDLSLLAGERFITYDATCDIRAFIDNVFTIVNIAPTIVLESSHDSVIYSSVAANYGIALVPAPLGKRRYHVKALTITNDLPNREIFLSWKNVKYMSPAVEQFRDFILEQGALLDDFRREVDEE